MARDNIYVAMNEMLEMLEYLRAAWNQNQPAVNAKGVSIAQAYGTLVMAIVELDRKAMDNLR